MILLKVLAFMLYYPLIVPLMTLFPQLRLPALIGSSSRSFERGNFSKSFELATEGLLLIEKLVSKSAGNKRVDLVEVNWDLLGSIALDSAQKLNDIEKALLVSTMLRNLVSLAPDAEVGKTLKGPYLVNRLKTIFSSSDPEHEAYWNSWP